VEPGADVSRGLLQLIIVRRPAKVVSFFTCGSGLWIHGDRKSLALEAAGGRHVISTLDVISGCRSTDQGAGRDGLRPVRPTSCVRSTVAFYSLSTRTAAVDHDVADFVLL